MELDCAGEMTFSHFVETFATLQSQGSLPASGDTVAPCFSQSKNTNVAAVVVSERSADDLSSTVRDEHADSGNLVGIPGRIEDEVLAGKSEAVTPGYIRLRQRKQIGGTSLKRAETDGYGHRDYKKR
jgi:hypothetical protein